VITQSRGYQSNLEIAKLFSKQRKLPLLLTLLDSYPDENTLTPTNSPFQINSNVEIIRSLSNLRVGVVGNLMQSEYIYHHFAKELKSLGALWVSNWIMIRVPNKKTQTCSILS
jgi:hypothetical protein